MERPVSPPRRRDRRVIGPFTLGQLLVVLGVLLAAAVLLLLLSTPLAPGPAGRDLRPGSSFVLVGERTEGLTVGAPAPALAGAGTDGAPVLLRDLAGEPIDLATERGRVVWVNFFATWCPPCQEETPVLRMIDERYGDADVSVIGVSVQETAIEDVAAYAETYGLGFRIGFDTGSDVFRAWRGFGLPTQVFLDAEGIVGVIHYGPLRTEQVEAILAELRRPAASPSPAGSTAPAG